MTPFDPSALLAILLAFYQPATPANLARAFAERNEYFGGGQLIGTHSDALRLPDGAVWDLIFAVDGPEPSAYQAIIPSGSSDAGGDPLFPLAPGPLRPAPPGVLPLRRAGEVFQPIVADAIGELHAADDVIGSKRDRLADADTLSPAMRSSGPDVDDAGAALTEELGGLDAVRPDDVIDQTDGQNRRAGAFQSDYDDGEPGDMDTSARGLPPGDEAPPKARDDDGLQRSGPGDFGKYTDPRDRGELEEH